MSICPQHDSRYHAMCSLMTRRLIDICKDYGRAGPSRARAVFGRDITPVLSHTSAIFKMNHRDASLDVVSYATHRGVVINEGVTFPNLSSVLRNMLRAAKT